MICAGRNTFIRRGARSSTWRNDRYANAELDLTPLELNDILYYADSYMHEYFLLLDTILSTFYYTYASLYDGYLSEELYYVFILECSGRLNSLSKIQNFINYLTR